VKAERLVLWIPEVMHRVLCVMKIVPYILEVIKDMRYVLEGAGDDELVVSKTEVALCVLEVLGGAHCTSASLSSSTDFLSTIRQLPLCLDPLVSVREHRSRICQQD